MPRTANKGAIRDNDALASPDGTGFVEVERADGSDTNRLTTQQIGQLGGILDSVEYYPASAQSVAAPVATTAAPADLAAAAIAASWTGATASMFDLTFKVPPSGKVLIQASAMVAGVSNIQLHFGLSDTVSAITPTISRMTNTSVTVRAHYAKKLTGLTPGATYTVRLQVSVNSGTGNVYAGGTTGGVQFWAQAA